MSNIKIIFLQLQEDRYLGELIMKLIKSDVGIVTILTMLLFALVKYQDASAADDSYMEKTEIPAIIYRAD